MHEAQSRREVCQRRSCLVTKKMGACQKKTECAGVLLSLLVQNKKHLQYLSFDQDSRYCSLPPLQLESVCCFSKKNNHNITVRPEENIFLNLKLWDRLVGVCLSSLSLFFIILVVIAQLAGWLISISTAKINIALETRHPRNTNATTNHSRLQGCWAERLVDASFCIF